jgi:hypothetical protein
MAARNELLRLDGRHTAHDLLEKIEAHLVVQPAVDRESEPRSAAHESGEEDAVKHPLPTPSWSTLIPQASGTESSAWIPLVRPPPKEGK